MRVARRYCIRAIGQGRHESRDFGRRVAAQHHKLHAQNIEVFPGHRHEQFRLIFVNIFFTSMQNDLGIDFRIECQNGLTTKRRMDFQLELAQRPRVAIGLYLNWLGNLFPYTVIVPLLIDSIGQLADDFSRFKKIATHRAKHRAHAFLIANRNKIVECWLELG